MVNAWLLTFFLFGQQHFIPGIESEAACRALARDLSTIVNPQSVDASYIAKGKCFAYPLAVYK